MNKEMRFKIGDLVKNRYSGDVRKVGGYSYMSRASDDPCQFYDKWDPKLGGFDDTDFEVTK